jgi:hypothetical protein
VFVGLSVTRAVIDRIQSGAAKTELMSTWKFGCPADPTQVGAAAASTAAAAASAASKITRLGLGCGSGGARPLLGFRWSRSRLVTCAASVLLPSLILQFLRECGWQLQLATDRARQAAALGLDPALCSFPAGGAFFAEAGGSDKGASLFLVATSGAGAV